LETIQRPCVTSGLRAALAAREPVLTLECGAGRSAGVFLAINASYCADEAAEEDTGLGDGCYLLGADATQAAAVRALDALALPASGRLDPHLPSFHAWGFLAPSCWRCACYTYQPVTHYDYPCYICYTQSE